MPFAAFRATQRGRSGPAHERHFWADCQTGAFYWQPLPKDGSAIEVQERDKGVLMGDFTEVVPGHVEADGFRRVRRRKLTWREQVPENKAMTIFGSFPGGCVDLELADTALRDKIVAGFNLLLFGVRPRAGSMSPIIVSRDSNKDNLWKETCEMLMEQHFQLELVRIIT